MATLIKTSYDPEADAMFIWFGTEDAISAETMEVSPGVMLDYDATGRLISIEVLDPRERARHADRNEVSAA